MHRALALLVALATGACGHSATSVRKAKNSLYDVEFAAVWNAVTEEIHERFPDVVVEDPVKGVVITGFRRMHLQDEQQRDLSSQTANQKLGPGQTAYGQNPFIAFRMTAEVRSFATKKGPPWRVIIDGEVAEYKPGLAQLIPIKHGQADEPPWVQNRIDAMVMDVHERLARYAITREIKKEDIGSKTFDTTPWADLPDRAAVGVIGRVHDAALARDTAGLRATMVDDFRWGLGGEGSADTALALWAADTSKLRELARVLERGCGLEEATGEVVCPQGGAQGKAMARFKKVSGDWKFVVFLTK
jgi:hypothetical protein